MNTFITNVIIVFGSLIILWKVDFTPEKATTVPAEQKPQQEEYHPFSNNVSGSTGELVKHQYYRLSYNEKTEQADWVAYMVTSQMLTGDAERKNNFKSDPDVATGSASKNDYKGTKFDRGHLMPAATCKFDQDAMNETFYMSNMSPQYYSFNRGIWKKAEEQVRDWVKEYGHLYVVSGPAAFYADSVIGENEVAVPSMFYKVMLYKEGNTIETAGFLFENKKITQDPHDFIVTVDSVEQVCGLDFFWELQDSVEDGAEKVVGEKFTSMD